MGPTPVGVREWPTSSIPVRSVHVLDSERRRRRGVRGWGICDLGDDDTLSGTRTGVTVTSRRTRVRNLGPRDRQGVRRYGTYVDGCDVNPTDTESITTVVTGPGVSVSVRDTRYDGWDRSTNEVPVTCYLFPRWWWRWHGHSTTPTVLLKGTGTVERTLFFSSPPGFIRSCDFWRLSGTMVTFWVSELSTPGDVRSDDD